MKNQNQRDYEFFMAIKKATNSMREGYIPPWVSDDTKEWFKKHNKIFMKNEAEQKKVKETLIYNTNKLAQRLINYTEDREQEIQELFNKTVDIAKNIYILSRLPFSNM